MLPNYFGNRPAHLTDMPINRSEMLQNETCRLMKEAGSGNRDQKHLSSGRAEKVATHLFEAPSLMVTLPEALSPVGGCVTVTV